jgi:hypothetical protein
LNAPLKMTLNALRERLNSRFERVDAVGSLPRESVARAAEVAISSGLFIARLQEVKLLDDRSRL